MTNLHDLPKIRTSKRRKARGISAGQGKTAGRGTKGQKARSGHNIPTGFEGGQTKLYKRLPKRRGELNTVRTSKATVTLDQLDSLFTSGQRVTPASLRKAGAVANNATSIKVVARGKLSKTLKFSGLTFSSTAYKQLFGSNTKN